MSVNPEAPDRKTVDPNAEQLWHVFVDGKKHGPIGVPMLERWAREGRLKGSQILRHGDEAWVPLEKTWLHALSPTDYTKPIAWVGGSLCVFLGLLYLVFSGRSPAPYVPPRAEIVASAPVAPEAPPKVSIADLQRIMPKTPGAAVTMAIPVLGDHAGQDIGEGAAMLTALLGAFAPSEIWAHLESVPDNSRAEVMKDPAPFRGRKLCSRGTVEQISVNRELSAPVWTGVMATGSYGVISFVAHGSSSGIVQGSPARFCGYVVGLHTYETVQHNEVVSVEAVGLFDLPENR